MGVAASAKSPHRDRVFVAREAWDFVLTRLEPGVAIEVISLDLPTDIDGCVLRILTDNGPRPLYIKLQRGPEGRLVGRSFHDSDPSSLGEEEWRFREEQVQHRAEVLPRLPSLGR